MEFDNKIFEALEKISQGISPKELKAEVLGDIKQRGWILTSGISIQLTADGRKMLEEYKKLSIR